MCKRIGSHLSRKRENENSKKSRSLSFKTRCVRLKLNGVGRERGREGGREAEREKNTNNPFSV